MVKWFKRRVLGRVQYRSPIEVYFKGKLFTAGVGTIKTSAGAENEVVITVKGRL